MMDKFCVTGDGKTRGRIIGEAFRNEIKAMMEVMRESEIPAMFREPDWSVSVRRFAADTGIYDNFKSHAGRLYDELEGMAEAAEVDVKELIIFNCLDEISSYSSQNKIEEKCTCIGIKRKCDGGVLVAQNMDLSPHLNRYQTILHVKYDDSDLEQLIFTIPGLLSLAGVNNRSVAVVPNALTTLKCNWRGMPVTLILRNILEKDSAEQAAYFVKSALHGAAQNYTIGDKNAIYSLECSGFKKEEFKVKENAYFEYLAHTNHPLKNDEISVSGRKNMPYSSYESSLQRLDTAETRLRDADCAFGAAELEGILSSHEHEPNCICRHGLGINKGVTVGSAVYDLSGEIEMHFAKGNGCCHPYEKFAF